MPQLAQSTHRFLRMSKQTLNVLFPHSITPWTVSMKGTSDFLDLTSTSNSSSPFLSLPLQQNSSKEVSLVTLISFSPETSPIRFFLPPFPQNCFYQALHCTSCCLNPVENHQSSFCLTCQQHLSCSSFPPLEGFIHRLPRFLLTHWSQLFHLLCCFFLIYLTSQLWRAPGVSSTFSFLLTFTALVISSSLQL